MSPKETMPEIQAEMFQLRDGDKVPTVSKAQCEA